VVDPQGATPEDLMDMAGNVWQWMQNWYGEDHPARVLRAGSWIGNPLFCRSACRYTYAPDDRGGNVGCRVALDFQQ
jgi:formylglycine-generating enzyme required for sulfatase activity